MNFSSQTVSAETIINFWFNNATQPNWFNANPVFDQQLTRDYAQVVEQALAGDFDNWMNSAAGSLALIILLDQFPLNMYRGKAKSFCGESKAIAICKHAIANGFDHTLQGAQLAFLYIPLMHSENLADQDLSVKSYETAGLQDNLYWARHHREIVRQFGRFPHRNAILGRESSAEEKAYLNSDQAFRG